MVDMDIPDEAVEAAVFAVSRNYGSSGTPTNTILWNRLVSDVRTALKAAAPHMLAEAWEEGEVAGQDNRDSNRGYSIEHKYNPYRSQP